MCDGYRSMNNNAWGVKPRDEVVEPVVSLVEIMSEELAANLQEEDEKRDENLIASLTDNVEDLDDFALAQSLQREFDREYDLSVRLEEERKKGNKTVQMTPDRYCPKTTQESDDSCDEDDDNLREVAIEMLYSKLEQEAPVGVMRTETGELITKHDSRFLGRRNADKALNDTINVHTGDMLDEQISNRVYNTLRSFSKTETKRQHRLKDKEEIATMETSVDAQTRLALFKWINQGVFDRVDGVIATGKESAVLNAVLEEKEFFAIKVYKQTLSEFKNRSEYVKDDFRFKNPRSVLKIWAEREYMNLKRMTNHELPCPSPIKLKKHLLVMSLIGVDGAAAPRLKNVNWDFKTLEERTEIYNQVQDIVCRMYKDCRLVHGDLSEYNLLLVDNKVYVIDVSQAMDISHPRNLHYLTRDIENVLMFFGKMEVPDLPTAATLFNMVTGLAMEESDDLLVQVEQFSRDNRCVELRQDKACPADRELRLYKAEKAERLAGREASPAREYN